MVMWHGKASHKRAVQFPGRDFVPWEVRVSLFSPCPSQVQLPAAGLASQQPSHSSPPARLLDESPGNCRGPELGCLHLSFSGQGSLMCSWREDQGAWPVTLLTTKVKGWLLVVRALAQDEPC